MTRNSLPLSAFATLALVGAAPAQIVVTTNTTSDAVVGFSPVDGSLVEPFVFAVRDYAQVSALAVVPTGLFMMYRVRNPLFDRNPYLFSDATWGVMYVLHGLAGIGLVALTMAHIYFAIRPEKVAISLDRPADVHPVLQRQARRVLRAVHRAPAARGVRLRRHTDRAAAAAAGEAEALTSGSRKGCGMVTNRRLGPLPCAVGDHSAR